VRSFIVPILKRPKTPTEEITIDTLLLELEEARNVAMVTGQAAALKACTMGKAELLGYLVQRAETGFTVTVHLIEKLRGMMTAAMN
jgi:hypothetical protein